MREFKASGLIIHENADKKGIPQGSPISSTFANIYMSAFDRTVADWCRVNGAFYRRYSDDILVICDTTQAAVAENIVMDAISAEELQINPTKTERTTISATSLETAQYLGFSLRYDGASIRPSSMSRQWRKLRKAAKRIEQVGRAAIASGKSTKIYTKKLRKRFSSVRVRNFSAYAMRSGDALTSKTIRKQALRLERELERIIERFSSP